MDRVGCTSSSSGTDSRADPLTPQSELSVEPKPSQASRVGGTKQ